MVMKVNKKVVRFAAVLLIAGGIALFAWLALPGGAGGMFAGGHLQAAVYMAEEAVPAVNTPEEAERARFQRPAKAPPLENPYSFQDFQGQGSPAFLQNENFSAPEDVILAYYGILRDAANTLGYSGGCGTVGNAGLPYPYAYALLTTEKRQEMPLQQFIDSFSGIGYTSLLKLVPAYAPAGTPANRQYYMAELEIITGRKAKTEEDYGQGSLFAYYYGLVAVEKEAETGWRIREIHYVPEDFLCAPMHGWSYQSDAVVQIVYGENLKLVEKVEKTEQDGDGISVYASGHANQYRFAFIRLTNGYDILLHEYVWENDHWRETSLLTQDWRYIKLQIDNGQFRGCAHKG